MQNKCDFYFLNFFTWNCYIRFYIYYVHFSDCRDAYKGLQITGRYCCCFCLFFFQILIYRMCILKIFQNFSAAVIRHCLYFDPPYFRTFLIFFCNGNLPHLVNKLNNESSHHLVGSLKREINQPTFFLTVIPLIMLKLPQLLSKNRRQTQVLNSTIFLLPGKSPFPGIKTMEVR